MTEEKEQSQSKYVSEDYLTDIRNDTKIDQFNLREECSKTINRTQRYVEDYYQQRRKLKQIEILKDKIIGELFNYYKTEFELKLTSSQDIMKFVCKDDKYVKIMKQYHEQESLLDFLDRTIKNLNNKVWLIKDMVELEKLG